MVYDPLTGDSDFLTSVPFHDPPFETRSKIVGTRVMLQEERYTNGNLRLLDPLKGFDRHFLMNTGLLGWNFDGREIIRREWESNVLRFLDVDSGVSRNYTSPGTISVILEPILMSDNWVVYSARKGLDHGPPTGLYFFNRVSERFAFWQRPYVQHGEEGYYALRGSLFVWHERRNGVSTIYYSELPQT